MLPFIPRDPKLWMVLITVLVNNYINTKRHNEYKRIEENHYLYSSLTLRYGVLIFIVYRDENPSGTI